MKTKFPYHLFCAVLFMMVSCRQQYNPPAAANATTNYLVVDGFVNSGADTTTITLSRTRSLGLAPYPSPEEKGAQVVVEGDGGFSATLTDLGNGKYIASNLNLSNSQQYRLNITTSNGSKYLSEFEPVKNAPAIDSISFLRNDTSGVTVYANTHDPQNNTRYYRWDYVETWEYHSPYPSFWRWNAADSMVISAPTQTPHVCWASDNSINISLASSANLAQDVVYRAPLTALALNSEKIGFKYSILVKQYALTADAYNYWQNVKKTSEQGGTLFDQEPSQITGNIHSATNPNEPVLGFVSVGSVAQQRIFISNSQVQPWNYEPPCNSVPVILDSVAYRAINDIWLPVQEIPVGSMGNRITGFMMANDYCVDCSVRFGVASGTTIQPPFWQ